jgi:hypothetical protein
MYHIITIPDRRKFGFDPFAVHPFVVPGNA